MDHNRFPNTESYIKRLEEEQIRRNDRKNNFSQNPERTLLNKERLEQRVKRETIERGENIQIAIEELLSDPVLFQQEAKLAARAYELRCVKFKRQLPLVGKIDHLNYTLVPQAPNQVTFSAEDGLSTATVKDGEAFAEIGLIQDSYSINYQGESASAHDFNLSREVYATSDGSFSEAYYLGGNKFERIRHKPDPRLSAVAKDFVASHPEYELDESGLSFSRSEISPDESFGTGLPDGFQQLLYHEDVSNNARKKEQSAFSEQGLGDLSEVKTFADFGAQASHFADHAKDASTFVHQVAAYAKLV